MTQDAPQRRRKREPDLRVNLDLVDSLELIFNRVFGGNDLRLVALDFQQRTIERGGFSRTGRAGDQHNAVRQTD